MFETEAAISQATTLLVNFLPKVVGVLVLLILTWIVAGWIGRRTRRTLAKKLDQSLSEFFGNLVRYAIILFGILGCLRIFGFETTSFAAVIGAAGLAVGLALQGTLSNFAAGVMLLVFRPFKVGDVISVGDVMGKVVEIALFTTQFDTNDNIRVIMPNGSIFGSTIRNLTFHDLRRVDVAVGTDYGGDTRDARKVLLEAAARVEGIAAEPAPAAVLTQLGGSSVDWSVRVWAPPRDFFAVKERLTQEVKLALDSAGIGIPFPQLDVHMDRLD